MKLIVFGASGGTGRLVVSGALDRGYQVTAVARHLDGLPSHPDLALQPADVLAGGRPLREIAVGHDAAISAIGSTARNPNGIYSKGGQGLTALEGCGTTGLKACATAAPCHNRPEVCATAACRRMPRTAVPRTTRPCHRRACAGAHG